MPEHVEITDLVSTYKMQCKLYEQAGNQASDSIFDNTKLTDKDKNYLNGLKILDIGCGGGLISEPMARLGATVTGIDASEKNIKVASLHSKKAI